MPQGGRAKSGRDEQICDPPRGTGNRDVQNGHLAGWLMLEGGPG